MSSVYPAALSLGVLSCLLSAQSLVKTERSRQVLFGDVTALNKTKNPLCPERLGTRLVCDHYKPTTPPKKMHLKSAGKIPFTKDTCKHVNGHVPLQTHFNQ